MLCVCCIVLLTNVFLKTGDFYFLCFQRNCLIFFFSFIMNVPNKSIETEITNDQLYSLFHINTALTMCMCATKFNFNGDAKNKIYV